MAYERYGRGDTEYRREGGDRRDEPDFYGAGDPGGYGRDRDASYAQRDQGQREGARDYGRRDYGQRDYGQRDYGQRDYGQRDYGASDYGQRSFADADRYQGLGRRNDGPGAFGQGRRAAGFGSDGRYEERSAGAESYYRGGQDRGSATIGRDQPAPHRSGSDRGFFERAGDEVRSWFGDEQAEHRREQDARHDERGGRGGSYARDEHYHDWRDQQIASFDRDYHEYRQENREKFHNEFSSWRSERQGQRDLLARVTEHAEVVGSDGEHVGTVDKVHGDRVILTKSDPDAGGRHHSFPSRWLQAVDDGKATLTKTGAQAKQHWQDEQRQSALFNGRQGVGEELAGPQASGADPNRNPSGRY